MADIEDMGPIDYVVIEWPDQQPTGSAMPHLIDLADRDLIRILDLTFIQTNEDGSCEVLEIEDLPEAFQEFRGARSGLLDDEDLAEAASALEPGTSAAVLVWENRWVVPFARSLRESGAQLVASGRIPVQALLAEAGVR